MIKKTVPDLFSFPDFDLHTIHAQSPVRQHSVRPLLDAIDDHGSWLRTMMTTANPPTKARHPANRVWSVSDLLPDATCKRILENYYTGYRHDASPHLYSCRSGCLG